MDLYLKPHSELFKLRIVLSHYMEESSWIGKNPHNRISLMHHNPRSFRKFICKDWSFRVAFQFYLVLLMLGHSIHITIKSWNYSVSTHHWISSLTDDFAFVLALAVWNPVSFDIWVWQKKSLYKSRTKSKANKIRREEVSNIF